MLIFVGLPMFFMEMVLGQYGGLSATKIYARLFPGMKGMGYGMISIPTIINFYYTVIMAYAFFFLFSGFTSDLPWGHCAHDYNTMNCYSLTDAKDCTDMETYWNNTCTSVEAFCTFYGFQPVPDDYEHCRNATGDFELSDVTKRVAASEDFWYRRVLGLDVELGAMSNRWDHWGGMRWDILGCLALSWILICLSLIKGIASYGKVVYFTTLFPYVVLTTLLIYVSTLDGFDNGINYYLTPDWDKLSDMSVWNDAAGQIFYSLGVGVGSQLLLSSYNGFTTNAHRDALLIGLCNSLTSLYAGFVVFGVVGYIAVQKNVLIEDVIDAGAGLAFIVYPEAVSIMAVSPLFSFLFFFMLILLAISSVCGSWEALVASFMDEYPQFREHRIKVMIGSTFIAFLAGVAICFDSGFLLFQMMDNRCSNAILLMAFVELVSVSWFYGIDSFLSHIRDMKMWMPEIMAKFWTVCWVFITPLIIAAVTLLAWINHVDDEFLGYKFPSSIQGLGWILEITPVGIVFIFSALVVFRKWRNGEDVAFFKIGPMLTPEAKWGPRPDHGMPELSGKDNDAYLEKY